MSHSADRDVPCRQICVWNMEAKPPAVVRTFTHDVHIHGLAWRPTTSTTDAPSTAAAMLAMIDADGEMEVLTDVLPPAPAAPAASASPAKGAAAATQAKTKAPRTAAAGSDADSDADMGEPSTAAAGAGAAPTAAVVTSSKKNHRRAVVADSDDDSDDSDSEAPVKAKKVLLKEGEASRARKDTGNISALKRTLAALDEDPTVEFGAEPTSVLDHPDTTSLAGAGTGALGMVKVQGAFMPNATVMGEDDDDAMVQLQYLAFNRRGAVLAIDTAGVRGIEVVFADTTTHRSMRFADNYNFVMGALGSEGVALASQSYEEDDDGAEGSRTVPSTIMYRPYVSWSGKSAQWVFKLPQGEDADVIACGQKFVAVATSSQVRVLRCWATWLRRWRLLTVLSAVMRHTACADDSSQRSGGWFHGSARPHHHHECTGAAAGLGVCCGTLGVVWCGAGKLVDHLTCAARRWPRSVVQSTATWCWTPKRARSSAPARSP